MINKLFGLGAKASVTLYKCISNLKNKIDRNYNVQLINFKDVSNS